MVYRKLCNTTGEACTVKRRPDGTLTIFSAPIFDGADDLDMELDDKGMCNVSLGDELDAIINHGVVIGIDAKDSDFKDRFGEYVSNHSPVLALLCKERIKPIIAKYYKAEGIKYSEDGLNEAAMNRASYLEFYTRPNYTASIEDILADFGQHSFFPPDFVWIKGAIYDVSDL